MSLSLSPVRSFLWLQRLLLERRPCGLSRSHYDVGRIVQTLLEAGEDQFSHAEVAAAARCCVRTVGEALRRLRVLGLLGWRAQYEASGGLRRRRENQYWLSLPGAFTVPAPDLCRRRFGKTCRAISKQEKEALEGAASCPPAGFEGRLLAKFAEERRRRCAWRLISPFR